MGRLGNLGSHHLVQETGGRSPQIARAVCSGGRKPFSIRTVPGLDTPVMYVRGVGPKVAEMLAVKGILTAEDLLYHLPFRYEDRQNPRGLDELKARSEER